MREQVATRNKCNVADMLSARSGDVCSQPTMRGATPKSKTTDAGQRLFSTEISRNRKHTRGEVHPPCHDMLFTSGKHANGNVHSMIYRQSKAFNASSFLLLSHTHTSAELSIAAATTSLPSCPCMSSGRLSLLARTTSSSCRRCLCHHDEPRPCKRHWRPGCSKRVHVALLLMRCIASSGILPPPRVVPGRALHPGKMMKKKKKKKTTTTTTTTTTQGRWPAMQRRYPSGFCSERRNKDAHCMAVGVVTVRGDESKGTDINLFMQDPSIH